VLIIDPSPRNLECDLLIKSVKEVYPATYMIVLASEPMPVLRYRMRQLGVDVYLEKLASLPSPVDALCVILREIKERAHAAPVSNDSAASKEEVMYDLVIIGGGPVALSAACYAMGKKLNFVMVYEDLGGKVGWLESLIGPDQTQYLPGNELAHQLTVRVMAQADRIINDRVRAVAKHNATFRIDTEAHGALQARTVLVATGATPIQLNVPGAQRFTDRGLGYSITTYAHLVAGQRVAVLGATRRALSGAAELAHTAARVFVIASDSPYLATPLGHALQQHPNVEILEGYAVTEIIGGDTVEALMIVRDGRPRRIEVDRVFVALGVVPNSAIVRDIVETDTNGFILVNAYHETSLPGLYAAGDVSTMFTEQVLIAIGDGARAAMSAYDYLLAQWLIPDDTQGGKEPLAG